MKKKAFLLALLVASGSAVAAPGLGSNAAARPAGLNLFPNLGNTALATPPRAAQAPRLGTTLANGQARSLPGLEALGARFDGNAGRPRILGRDGSADGDASFDFDSSTSTNSDGSTSRTLTTSFQREADASRTTRSRINDEASRTVETASSTALDTALTINREGRTDSSPEGATGRSLRLGKVELSTDYKRDASRSVSVDGTESSDGERNTASSSDYAGTFDSSRPFDGRPLNVEYRSERTRANGETVVRSGDSAALTPAARGQLRDNARDNAAQRQDNRQERRATRAERRDERRDDRASNN